MVKLLNVDCDLTGKKIRAGESVLVSIGGWVFGGIITYYVLGFSPPKIEVWAGGQISKLVIGKDQVARGTLFVP